MVIYFILQSLLEIRNKNLPCFPSKQESSSPPSVYFVNSRSDSYANKSYEFSSLLIHFIAKLKWNGLVVCLQHCTRWRHVKFLYWRRWHFRSCWVQWKLKCGLYLVIWDVLYFCRPNKCHIYATPLRSKYLLWLHCLKVINDTFLRVWSRATKMQEKWNKSD